MATRAVRRQVVCCDGVFDFGGKDARVRETFRPLFFFVDAFGTGVLTFRFVFTVKQTSLFIQAVFQWLA